MHKSYALSFLLSFLGLKRFFPKKVLPRSLKVRSQTCWLGLPQLLVFSAEDALIASACAPNT